MVHTLRARYSDQKMLDWFLRASAERLADKECLVFGNRRWSYGEVDRDVDRAAHALRAAGVERGDRVGIYLDNSPAEPGMTNVFSGNAVRLCELGVSFHASTRDNRFLGNRFRGNDVQVRVDGGGDALGNEWLGNDFDDYAGYDLDRDGVGDVAYELRSLSGNLRARHPQLDYLRGAPSLFLVDAASQLLPIVRPTAVLVDPRPLAGRGTSESSRAH